MACPSATERLSLREIESGDLAFVASMLADPEVMRFYPKCLSREESSEWIARQRWRYASDGYSLWLVSDKRSGEPVGQVGLIRQMLDGVAEDEIGYLIARAHWRRGFAYEAALATRDYAFSTLDRRRVIALIRPVNTASQGVARKLGMAVLKTTCCWDLEHLVFGLERRPLAAGAQGDLAEGSRP